MDEVGREAILLLQSIGLPVDPEVLGRYPLSPEPFLPLLPFSPLPQYRTHWLSSTELVKVMLWIPPFTCRAGSGIGESSPGQGGQEMREEEKGTSQVPGPWTRGGRAV